MRIGWLWAYAHEERDADGPTAHLLQGGLREKKYEKLQYKKSHQNSNSLSEWNF